MILCIENPQDAARKLLELIDEFSKTAGYKMNAQKSLAFLHANNDISEREIKWESSNPSIATVVGNNRTAKVIAKSAGTCEITAFSVGLKNVCTINVKGPVEEIEELKFEEDIISLEFLHEKQLNLMITQNTKF